MSTHFPLPLVTDPPLVVPTAGSPADERGPLVDTFGRVHNNLRISVTDRCNLRCTYCMPEDVVFRDRDELLTFEEITRFVTVAARLGVDKVRLTGGEPLLRRDLPALARMIVAVPGIRDVGLTTNGILLARQARDLYAAGLRRLNVSLDTLDPGRFRELTRRDGVDRVVEGLLAAKAAGFAPIKVNAVAIRGFVERDAAPLARFCREHGFEMRFIEYMPIGAEAWERAKLVPAQELLTLLAREVAPLAPAPGHDPRDPALAFDYADGGGRVGVIASVTRPFCGSCNRVRLTAEGKLRNCLFALNEVDVKPLLRGPAPDDARLAAVIRASVAAKWAGHQIGSAAFVKPDRTMHAIGG
ncbi:GTP 3',8-cyclase MoaA [Fimbriiglobus ruber]|uniref:GTP 3',8-cyclase n=1 Tax=Fimbriiglobus ruber TaxID=1908690 RepID=A0A225DUW9_9BACT|nr:GTP 3',8-cyclase MoaA [Fimbriiglobus ruber]OWK45131.1 Molybdenum cofactor biosynthesis protein MoaA [Fimbriiglobus ruber]